MPNVVKVEIRVDSQRQLDEIERARRFQSLLRVVESPRAEFERMEVRTRAARMITSESVLAQTQRLERERRMLTEARSPALVESSLAELERQQRTIDMYRRGESPVDQYERVMRERARIEESLRPTRPGLGIGPHPMSLADMELQNEFLERKLALLLIERLFGK